MPLNITADDELMWSLKRGRVTSWNERRGCGWIEAEGGGEDYWVHRTDLPKDRKLLLIGDTVEFIVIHEDSRIAREIELVGREDREPDQDGDAISRKKNANKKGRNNNNNNNGGGQPKRSKYQWGGGWSSHASYEEMHEITQDIFGGNFWTPALEAQREAERAAGTDAESTGRADLDPGDLDLPG